MFAPEGPTVRELAGQALSSVERGYDLLAPKFDMTPFRTPDAVLAAVTDAVRPLGPFEAGLDLCCGTGAGMGVLAQLCRGRIIGVDFSAGMLARARAAAPHAAGQAGTGSRSPQVGWVRADALDLPFRAGFDLVVSFGAFGHFLPRQRPRLFQEVRRVLRPGGRFVFPIAAPAPPGSAAYWAMLGFDTAMRLRNALWHPPFVMYYRTFRPTRVRRELAAAGLDATMAALPALGVRAGGGPRCGLVVAARPGEG